jgi:predicted nuclease with RNAse H fold
LILVKARSRRGASMDAPMSLPLPTRDLDTELTRQDLEQLPRGAALMRAKQAHGG